MPLHAQVDAVKDQKVSALEHEIAIHRARADSAEKQLQEVQSESKVIPAIPCMST